MRKALIDIVMVMYYSICEFDVYWGMKAFLFPLFFSPSFPFSWQ